MTAANRSRTARIAPHYEQIVVEQVRPSAACGRHPTKGVVGDLVQVEATIFRHGHDRVRAALWSKPPGSKAAWRQSPMTLVNAGLDLWRAELPLEELGRYQFTVSGWTDVYASWLAELAKRVRAAQTDVDSEIAMGLSIVDQVLGTARGESRRDV
jgi:starch synthase (maltosyl-transferring)